MEKIKLNASKRQNKKTNQLRKEGIIPANMYQAGKDSVALELDNLTFVKLSRHLNDNAVIYLQIADDKKELPVLIDEVQHDVYGKNILHVVFRKINLAEKIRADIAIELVGEFDVENGVLVLAKDSVEVEALPTDLPEKFEVDQGQLKAIGDKISLDSLEFDSSKVTIILGEDEVAEDIAIAIVQEKAEEIIEEVSEELVEPELAGEKKEEGEEDKAETPAEKPSEA
ncbi:MAG: 50S ribosomal protein L25 [Candidatus Pacebacteria bacterium GW2011_GWF2_38_9]|nr:MAG: 50S ribosomal protein L25, large subunit ribosomal protein L25 [candidate division TM6 bacterium GW2011_GWF2_28_16]KKQ07782.1 MAG: 50S ribosomal protein L25 [Candidatus Pacebacteria bacterium GW2011_GWF1_36_5]KKQ88394.1 MAG: 50S ribosomal protein L25 [Candidatus Pacebacteria bacterium GW2011_GWF2_38_9]HAZ73011.1 50S ribosomal protein L25 [Candidatus Paceibacterota bacterium]